MEIVAASNVSDDNQLPLNGGLETGMRHKFDSSVFFCWNRKTEQELETDEIYAPRRLHFQSYYREYKLNRFMWFVAMKNFECIFSFWIVHNIKNSTDHIALSYKGYMGNDILREMVPKLGVISCVTQANALVLELRFFTGESLLGYSWYWLVIFPLSGAF